MSDKVKSSWARLTPEQKRHKVEVRKRWRAANIEREREKSRKRSRDRRAKFPEEGKLYAKRNREKDPEKVRFAARNHHYKKLYGITLEQRDQIIASQGGVCFVCKTIANDAKHPWHVDHCHKTGRLRGVLCRHCNIALGHVRDNPELLRKLADYVESRP